MPHKGEVVLEVKDMYKNFGFTAASIMSISF